MRCLIVDDLGPEGEYAHFFKTHRAQWPPCQIDVLEDWRALKNFLNQHAPPDLIVLDMHFDHGPRALLAGDFEALVRSPRFHGDVTKAEAQLRRLQGVFILRALREAQFLGPVILFASLPQRQVQRLIQQWNPLKILEGLRFDEVKQALLWARQWRSSSHD